MAIIVVCLIFIVGSVSTRVACGDEIRTAFDAYLKYLGAYRQARAEASVVYTQPDALTIRITSARQATVAERQHYEQE